MFTILSCNFVEKSEKGQVTLNIIQFDTPPINLKQTRMKKRFECSVVTKSVSFHTAILKTITSDEPYATRTIKSFQIRIITAPST